MSNLPSSVLVLVSIALACVEGCSSTQGSAAANLTEGVGGSEVGRGGTSSSAGEAGTGAVSGAGGSSQSETGGAAPEAGGAMNAGGAPPGSGGIQPEAGGAVGTGGEAQASGGLGSAEGGSASIGGSASDSGGMGSGGTTVVDPGASAAINSCMDQLPWGARDLSPTERAPIVTAIINTCVEFAPPGEEWQQWCQMFLVAAINAESSSDVLAGTVGAGPNDDPSVGLLQIRFTSTVRDFADYGPVDALTRIGCDFGTVTSTDSWATKGDMMLDVNCNVAIGAWYYFIFGSGNGGTDAVWVFQYCQGGGVAGNLHIGMACHLMGAEAAHSSLSGADFYYDEIKSWFDPCVSYTGEHPFERVIEPDRGKYCR